MHAISCTENCTKTGCFRQHTAARFPAPSVTGKQSGNGKLDGKIEEREARSVIARIEGEGVIDEEDENIPNIGIARLIHGRRKV